MDLNSRINWLPGMEITAQTFIGLEADCYPGSVGKYADGYATWDVAEL